MFETNFIFLVNRVIREMTEDVLWITIIILLSGKPSKSFFEDVDFERVHRCDSNIDSEVKFQTIDQQWVLDVLRNDIGLFLPLRDVIECISNEYAFALARCTGLKDPQLFLLLVHLHLYLPHFLGIRIGQWNKIKMLLAIECLHPLNPLIE